MQDKYETTASLNEHSTVLDPKELPRNRILIKEELGSGAFGAVYKAEAVGMLGRDTFTVAVKKLKGIYFTYFFKGCIHIFKLNVPVSVPMHPIMLF